MKRSVICFAVGIVLLNIPIQAEHLRKRSLYDNEDDGGVQQLDEDLLNKLIEIALPRVNTAIAIFAPEPYDASNKFVGSNNIGSSRIPLWCKNASFDIDHSVGEMFGFSDLSIETMEVQPGSVSVDCGLLNSTWKGSFKMSVATPSMLMARDAEATLRASCAENGRELSWSIGGTMIAIEPSVSGLVDMTGTLTALGSLDVDVATVSEPLYLDFLDITASITETPNWIPNWIIENAVERMVDMYRNELIVLLDSRMRPGIEQRLEAASLFAPLQLVPIHFGFLANMGENRVDNFVNTTTNNLLGERRNDDNDEGDDEGDGPTWDEMLNELSDDDDDGSGAAWNEMINQIRQP